MSGPGVLLSSLAVAVGFAALRASEFEPFVNFGTMVGIATAGSTLGNLILLPACLTLGERGGPRARPDACRPRPAPEESVSHRHHRCTRESRGLEVPFRNPTVRELDRDRGGGAGRRWAGFPRDRARQVVILQTDRQGFDIGQNGRTGRVRLTAVGRILWSVHRRIPSPFTGKRLEFRVAVNPEPERTIEPSKSRMVTG